MVDRHRIEEAAPAELAPLLTTAVGWLREEWFALWLHADPDGQALRDELVAAGEDRLAARLGTDYLAERLDELATLVADVAGWLTDIDTGPPTTPERAAARWAATYRPALARLVDLYEHAARRNLEVRGVLGRLGWELDEPPGLLLTETAEDAFSVLHDGLQAAAGHLEEIARRHRAAVPDSRQLLAGELAGARDDLGRLDEAHARAWGTAQPRRFR